MDRDEYMTVTEARRLLRVSKGKMAKLIREGNLPNEDDPLDERVKLVKRSDAEALMKRNPLRPAA